MADPVHILVTVRKPELLPMAQMVFKSLRVGFPTARITTHLNNLSGEIENNIKTLAIEKDCVMVNTQTIHHKWITSLLERKEEPFWILDTDVHFYGSMEQFEFTQALTGWRIPQWNDEFSGCITRARLHTSLLRIDPIALWDKVSKFKEPVPDTPFTPIADLVSPLVVPFKGRRYFFDTMAMMYHAIGGEAFGPKHKDNFFHFGFGTIQDLVLPRLSNNSAMAEARKRIVENPVIGHGAWREQDDYYLARAA